MLISVAGKWKFAAFAVVLVFDIAVLALSVSVNIFQGFFFVADLFPLLLSIATLATILILVILELTFQNVVTARPVFEIPLLAFLSLFWLGFNAFSTERWKDIPMSCSSIPIQNTEVRSWCRNLQALRALIWIVWVIMSILTLSLLAFVISQFRNGYAQVWRTALSRFDPSSKAATYPVNEVSSFYRGSSLFNFGFGNHGRERSISSRDFFASTPVYRRGSTGSSVFGGGNLSPAPLVGLPTPPSGYQNRYQTDSVKGFDLIAGGTLEDDVWGEKNHMQ